MRSADSQQNCQGTSAGKEESGYVCGKKNLSPYFTKHTKVNSKRKKSEIIQVPARGQRKHRHLVVGKRLFDKTQTALTRKEKKIWLHQNEKLLSKK